MSHELNSAVAVVGIDIGKNSFHIVGQDKRGEIVLRQKWSRGQVEARAGQPVAVPDRHGGLRRRASSQSQASGVWPRRSPDAGEIRATVQQGPEERLPRCRGDRRGGATSDDEVRRYQDY